MEIPAAAFAEYHRAIALDLGDEWFAEFAERYIDRPEFSTFDDVEVTAIKPE